ncbi:hypothetical protein D3C81_1406760 [compost metagenome]
MGLGIDGIAVDRGRRDISIQRHDQRLHGTYKHTFLRLFQIASADIRMHTRQGYLQVIRFDATECEVGAAFITGRQLDDIGKKTTIEIEFDSGRYSAFDIAKIRPTRNRWDGIEQADKPHVDVTFILVVEFRAEGSGQVSQHGAKRATTGADNLIGKMSSCGGAATEAKRVESQ